MWQCYSWPSMSTETIKLMTSSFHFLFLLAIWHFKTILLLNTTACIFQKLFYTLGKCICYLPLAMLKLVNFIVSYMTDQKLFIIRTFYLSWIDQILDRPQNCSDWSSNFPLLLRAPGRTVPLNRPQTLTLPSFHDCQMWLPSHQTRH
jgi:hypothetical protein